MNGRLVSRVPVQGSPRRLLPIIQLVLLCVAVYVRHDLTLWSLLIPYCRIIRSTSSQLVLVCEPEYPVPSTLLAYASARRMALRRLVAVLPTSRNILPTFVVVHWRFQSEMFTLSYSEVFRLFAFICFCPIDD